MIQLYAFPGRSKRAAAATAAAVTAAARKLKQEQQSQGQDQGEGTAETAARGVKTEAELTAGAPVVDDMMDDAEAEAEAATTPSPGGHVVVAAGEVEGAGGESLAAEEEGLPVLLLRELASFRARFPQRVGKHLRADAAELFLKHQVRV